MSEPDAFPNTAVPQKRPLSYEELRDVIDLSLWAGQLLLQHGADSHRVEETVHRIGTSLGCNWMDILVSPNVLLVTTTSGQEFRTKTRRIVRIGVNLWVVTAVHRLSRRITSGELDRFQARAELERISTEPPRYNRWTVVLMVGAACAAFSQLFNGDWAALAITFGAAAVAMFARQELSKRHFNNLIIVTICALIAGLIAGGGAWLNLSQQPEAAIVSSVLLLVPGIYLINAAEDLIEGYVLIGLARGVVGLLISLAIALGLLIALRLTGVGSL